MTGTDVPDSVRRAVYARDDHQCIVNTRDCGGGLTLQHRVSRGMGGSKLLNGFANLVTMCLDHNTRLEADAAFATVGRRLGWKLETWENPEDVAVFGATTGWQLLTVAGGRIPCTARDEDQRAALRADRYAGWRQ